MKTLHVAAAVIVKGDMVLAAQRGYGPYKGGWEFPGGKIEEGETPEEALKREIREELDMEINVGKKLVEVVYDYPEIHLIMECYLCTVASGKPVLKEHEQARWLTPYELNTVDWLEADKKTVEALKRFQKDAERFEFRTVELSSPEFH
jgi:8-oxo-dGTP diphosphatase